MINARAVRCSDCGASEPDLVLTNERLGMTVAFCVECATVRVLFTVCVEHGLPLESSG